MRIAQVSPLFESVPPKLYGGTERVVSYLTDELVAAGHEVTLFATADSRTRAHLVPVCEHGLRLDPTCQDTMAHHVRLVEEVYRRARDFDFIHFHCEALHFLLSSREPAPHVTTLHGRLDGPDLLALFRAFPGEALVSISDAQRAPLPWADWRATVYHGLPADLLPFSERPGSYLAFLGRMSPEKRPDRAIAIARRAGLPLRMAAKVNDWEQDYFQRQIRPLLDPSRIEFVGEIGDEDKREFLGNALALLFPVDWPEPFGLVMIEALACGTPVIAWRRGSVPEIIQDGVTGFVVDDVAGAVAAVAKVAALSRRRVRDAFEERFTATRMAHDYVRTYRQIVAPTAARRHA